MQHEGVLHEAVIGTARSNDHRNGGDHPVEGTLFDGSTAECADGRLLMASTEFYAGEERDWSPSRIRAQYSADGGRSWSSRTTLVENTAGMNITNPHLLRLNSGALALEFCRQEAKDDANLYMRKSFDDGETWEEDVCVTPDKARHLMHNDAIQMESGRIIFPVAWSRTEEWRYWGDEQRTKQMVTPLSERDQARLENDSYRSACWYSDDDGVTWRRGRDDISLPRRGAMEPTLVERSDGSLLMLVRTQLGHQYRAVSRDGGDTWTDALPDPCLISSESPATVKRIPRTGDLLIVWNRVFDPHQMHFGRTPLTAAISKDDGETWGMYRNLETDSGHYYGYPSLFFRDDEVHVTYWRSRDEPATRGMELKLQILSTRFFYEDRLNPLGAT